MLVELCAGSAAVALRYLASDARPPLAYQGGKRGYADAILHALGLSPGAGRGQDVLLVEPGPWGEAWEVWRTKAGRDATVDMLHLWATMDPRELWTRLKSEPVPENQAVRVATWAVLQFWGFGCKPVYRDGGRWEHHGFNAVEAYREDYSAARRARDLEDWGSRRSRRLPDVIAVLGELPDLSRVHVLRCRAEEVDPIPGAVVLIDPPYAGTTCAYGADFPREAVLQVAERWRQAGCTVAVCEQEPLPLEGWHHHELGGPAGFGRTWSKQRREVLTMSRAAAGQMGLAL